MIHWESESKALTRWIQQLINNWSGSLLLYKSRLGTWLINNWSCFQEESLWRVGKSNHLVALVWHFIQTFVSWPVYVFRPCPSLAIAYGSIPTLSLCWRTYFDPRRTQIFGQVLLRTWKVLLRTWKGLNKMWKKRRISTEIVKQLPPLFLASHNGCCHEINQTVWS